MIYATNSGLAGTGALSALYLQGGLYILHISHYDPSAPL